MTQIIEISGKPYVSAEDAARMTGLSHRHVTRMAEAEKVPSKRLGRLWFISLRDLTTLTGSAPLPRQKWASPPGQPPLGSPQHILPGEMMHCLMIGYSAFHSNGWEQPAGANATHLDFSGDSAHLFSLGHS